MNPSSAKTAAAAALLQKYAAGERDFSGIDLSECSLSSAKLSGIVLKRANLKIVDLSTANLSHSNLQEAILSVSRLSGANLSQADLKGAQLNVTNLIRAVLVGADLSSASLIRAELLRADLSNANLVGANFQEADLREARLRWANLGGANLSRSNLRNGSLLGANLGGAQLSSAILEGTTLSGASLSGAELRHANLRSADLSGANLRGANLRWSNLSGANLREADLTDAKLSGADLTGAQLEGATLENTTLVHADCNRANLRRIRCVGCDLSGATLTGAQLYGAVSYDVQTTDTVCEWVDVSPLGDSSQQRYFDTAVELHTFLNHRPPQVRMVVDAALTHAANAALAAAYNQMGQQYPAFFRPPNIEITTRRTIFTFVADQEDALSEIAYLATTPFTDGDAVQKTLSDLIAQGLKNPSRSPVQEKSHRDLYETIQSFQAQSLKPLRDQLQDTAFFTSPIQLKLSNARGRTLELYQNPRFGIRRLPSSDSVFPIVPGHLPSPILSDYLAFLSLSQAGGKG